MKLAAFLETWRDFGRGVKALFISMMVLGATVFFFGMYADLRHTDWLRSYSYLPNILAGFTGFLVGVPVALVGLSTITGQREEKAASNRVHDLTRLAWSAFRTAVVDLCSEEKINALESGGGRIQQLYDRIFATFRDHMDPYTEPSLSTNHLLSLAMSEIPKWEKEFEDMEKEFGTNYDLRLRWFAILRDWNTLDQYVRLQRVERGLPWFERELDSYLQERMTADEYPMLDFFTIHEGIPKSDESKSRTMLSLIKGLEDVQQARDETLIVQIVLWPHLYRPEDNIKYRPVVERTASAMRALKNTIEAVERSGWPN